MRKKRVQTGYKSVLSKLGWTVRNDNWIEKDNIVMKKVYKKGIVKWGIFKDNTMIFTAEIAKDCLKFIKEELWK